MTCKDENKVHTNKCTTHSTCDRSGMKVRVAKKQEVVITWDLKSLSNEEYDNLSEYEKNNFCHHRGGIHWFYPDPERHVNRFHNPNVIPDFEKQANIAIRDIKKGEELSIADNTVEDF